MKNAMHKIVGALRAAAVMAALLGAAHVGAAEKELERTGGPYVPTPKVVVDEMLRMGSVGAKDFVVDLGSGDGVIVLTAAKEHKARGYGVDIDADLVKRSNAEAARLGIADRAAFHVQDVFKADLSKASVITLYLLPGMMVNLRSKLFLEPRPGTRIVSHDYNFDEWQPDDSITLDVPEKEKINGVPRATIMLWIVPAKVAGRWQVQVDAGDQYEVSLKQQYQVLAGSASAQGKPMKVSSTALRGEEIRFTLNDGGARRQFRGSVSGDAMQGTVDLGGGRSARWTAKRG
jgi:hypothetical protein